MRKKKELRIRVTTLILMCIGLCITSFALAYTWIQSSGQKAETGYIAINLNDKKPIITPEEFTFEPGMTVFKDFFIKNEGTWDVYYKLYFSEISGDLGDVLDVAILDQDGRTALVEGKLTDLTRNDVPAIEDKLNVGQTRNLKVSFHFPEQSGNDFQGKGVNFDFRALAVQTKNNPDKEFE